MTVFRIGSFAAGVAIGLTLTTAGAFADTINVPGDLPTIQQAIDAARDGDVVVLGDGTYTGPENRDLDFAGKLITLRSKSGAAACVIDCQGQTRALWFHSGETADARVIELTIRDARVVDANGGAVLCEPSGTVPSSPSFDGCVFVDNSAEGSLEFTGQGGAVACVGSHPSFTECTFDGNSAVGSGPNTAAGGAIALNDASHPTITACVFTGNNATGIGGIKGQASGKGGAINCRDDCMPAISQCQFTGNTAMGPPEGSTDTGIGGALQLSFGSDAIVSGCMFDGNAAVGVGIQSGLGGAVFVFFSTPLFERCVFTGSSASLAGGAMWVQQSQASIRNCTFNQSTAQSGGAIAAFDSGNAEIRACVFDGNSVDSTDLFQQQIGGGAVGTALSAAPTLVDCTFRGNSSLAGVGGAVSFTSGSTGTVVNCVFVDNVAADSGGAVNSGPLPSPLDAGSTTSISNCLFSCNEAGVYGGAVFSRSGALSVAGSTIVQNHAAMAGGGVAGLGSNVNELSNTVVYGNEAAEQAQLASLSNAVSQASYCVVEGGWPGVGNVDAEPGFVDSDGLDDDPSTCEDNDYRLAPGSPAIDAGDNELIPADAGDLDGDGDVLEPTPRDLDGNLRRADDQCTADSGNGLPPIVDIGAYEFEPIVDGCDCNENGVTDTEDIESGTSADFNGNLIPDECESAFAGAASWTAPGGGLFRISTNWKPSTPGPLNAAVFNLDSTYSVDFDLAAETNRLTVRRGDVTFDAAPDTDPFSYVLNAVDAPSIIVGDQGIDDGSLTIRHGELVSLGIARLGFQAGSHGLLRVIGDDASLTTQGSLCVGCFGSGEMVVDEGGHVLTRDAIIGDQPGSSGSVIVRGAGSVWEIPFFVTIDHGSLRVEHQATVIAGIDPFSGIFLFGDGQLSGDGLVQGSVVNFGTVRTIVGAGPLTIQGDYVQTGQVPGLGTDSGTLRVEVAGPTPGTGHGQLRVIGDALLAGGLFVEAAEGFTPTLGETYQIIDADSTTSQFDVAYLPALAEQLFLRVGYDLAGVAGDNAGTVTITVEQLGDLIHYGNPADTVVPGQPTDGTVGDFDGDGFADVAITIPAEAGVDGSVLVLINDGSGQQFSVIQQVTVGVDPSSITVGLLDDDELLDLAVANAGDDDVSILFGNGDGTFAPPPPGSEIPVGDQPVSIAAGNFHDAAGSGPGVTDLVVANFAGDNISLLVNGGGGVYIPIGLPFTLDTPSSVHPTDIDNDKDVDLLVTGVGDSVVVAFENLQETVFALAATLPVGAGPVDMPPTSALDDNAGFDLDRNGFADVITANAGDGTVSVVLNLGGFQFAPSVDLPVGDSARSLAALDMDGDGDVDLAVVVTVADAPATAVALRNDLNDGDQLAFASPIDLGAEGGTVFVLSGDLDGDEDQDLLTVNSGLGGIAGAGPIDSTVSVLPNLTTNLPGDVDGNGVVDVDDLVAVILAWGPCPRPPASCPADLDGSGEVDVDDLTEVILNWT